MLNPKWFYRSGEGQMTLEKTRNPKFEIRNKLQIRISECSKPSKKGGESSA
ncbi:hypothetical protein D1AOALGA4SA_64 [Olavius algarvensis Delta 1 endosymbiont]|nr:hypothetical protein D1AOALGA4SA_64 [Olavius algarvensis Delta 1 endosymbiont]